jgi:hypothetical protein
LEHFPNNGRGSEKKRTRFENGVRAALVGAAFLGAVGGAEVPKEGGFPQIQGAEAHESFNAEVEANGFLKYIAGLPTGIPNATGRILFRAQIEVAYDNFVLALAQRVPVYSADVPASLKGNIDNEMRAAARSFILPRAMAFGSREPALQALILILSEDSVEPPEDVRNAITR